MVLMMCIVVASFGWLRRLYGREFITTILPLLVVMTAEECKCYYDDESDCTRVNREGWLRYCTSCSSNACHVCR